MTKINSVGADPIIVAHGGTGLATLTANALYIGAGTSVPTALAVGTTGQVLAATTSSAPGWVNVSALNIVDNTTGTVASPTAMTVNTTYVADQATAITGFVLPATATQGSEITIIGNGPGGWQIQQNASQAIKFGGLTTTTGTSGSLSSTNRYNGVTLTASVGGASTIWSVNDFAGTLTFV